MPPIDLSQPADIMVGPDYKDEIEQRLKLWDIPYDEIIKNLARQIERTLPASSQLNRDWSSNGTLSAELLRADRWYREYHPYDEIEAKLKQLADLDPRVTLETISRSSEGRKLYLAKVSSDPTANKPVILIDAGHHAREVSRRLLALSAINFARLTRLISQIVIGQSSKLTKRATKPTNSQLKWITHATLIYVLESLVNVDVPRVPPRSCRTERCREATKRRVELYLNDYDYWFIPTVNPDGYEYSHHYDRLWRKTRSANNCWSARGNGGVDPNRNYPFHWGESGASTNPCSDIYAGPRPMSEPETRAVVSVVEANKDRIFMYISLHNFSQLILAPYGYRRVYPDNYNDLGTVANSWIDAYSSLRGIDFRFGTSAMTLYPAAGGSDDYVHAAGIKFAYTIELPDKGRHGFLQPKSEIIPIGQETVMGISAMVKTMGKIMAQR